MSEEQLKAFIAKVQADTSLQEQLKAEGADPVAITKAAGFSITAEDLTAYGYAELSDEEMEGASGGTQVNPFANPMTGGFTGGGITAITPYLINPPIN